MRKILWYILLGMIIYLIFRWFNSEESSKVTKSLVIEVNIRNRYPEKKLIFQDIGEVNYIPLETSNKVILDNGAETHCHISDSLIITYNRDGTVFVFDIDGYLSWLDPLL